MKGFAGAIALAALAACGGSNQEPAQEPYTPPPEPDPEPMVGAAPECVDESDNPVRCEEDDECCEGFVCGIDPALSARIKHCIYAGD